VLFADLAATSAAVAATSGRKAKIDLLADTLRRLRDEPSPDAIAAGAGYLSGELRQRQTGVGYASLRDLPPPAELPTLTVAGVDAAFAAMAAASGKGSQGERRRLVTDLFSAATADERRMLVGLLGGELRQGAQAGLLAEAIARAADLDVTTVRRALLLAGDLKAVAVAALTGGAAALAEYSLTVGRPLAPMLAQSAATVAEALEDTGLPAAADVKIDGVRIQVHRDGDDVAVFSRSLDDLTARMPGVVSTVRALPLRAVVLDGEAVGLSDTGRAIPFQETASKAARRDGVSILHPFFFDLLHLDGTDLLDEPGMRRWAALADAVPAALRVEQTMLGSVEDGDRAFVTAIDGGHEGLVIKAANAPYDVGRRGVFRQRELAATRMTDAPHQHEILLVQHARCEARRDIPQRQQCHVERALIELGQRRLELADEIAHTEVDAGRLTAQGIQQRRQQHGSHRVRRSDHEPPHRAPRIEPLGA